MSQFIVKRVLNNNAVIASDGNHDRLLLGLAIGFKKKINDTIPTEDIKRHYLLKDAKIYSLVLCQENGQFKCRVLN